MHLNDIPVDVEYNIPRCHQTDFWQSGLLVFLTEISPICRRNRKIFKLHTKKQRAHFSAGPLQ